MVKICPELQSHGACNDSSCQYRHDILLCEDCGIVCYSLSQYNAHISSKRHKRQISGARTFHRCPVCNVNFQGPDEWAKHVSGSGHRKKTARQGVSTVVEPEEAAATARSEYCTLCGIFVSRTLWTQHAQNSTHRKKEGFAAFKVTLEEAEKNKHGVTVSEGLDFGIVRPADARSGVSLQFSMETTVPASRITVVEAKLSSITAKNLSSA
jgi:helicase MOV-10